MGLGGRRGRFASQDPMSFSRKASDLRWDGLTAPTRMANAADVRSRLCKRVASVQLVALFGAVYSQMRTVHARVNICVDGRFLSAERRPAAVEGYAAESGGRLVDKLMVVGAISASRQPDGRMADGDGDRGLSSWRLLGLQPPLCLPASLGAVRLPGRAHRAHDARGCLIPRLATPSTRWLFKVARCGSVFRCPPPPGTATLFPRLHPVPRIQSLFDGDQNDGVSEKQSALSCVLNEWGSEAADECLLCLFKILFWILHLGVVFLRSLVIAWPVPVNSPTSDLSAFD
ncbi:hypothetical protein L1887_46927 [Cichorium endivia]|nr:hypothetical protein L1887_46927 [Cichorium endivia]